MDKGTVFVFKQKCVEVLKNANVKDLPPIQVVEIDTSMGLYEGFQVCLSLSFIVYLQLEDIILLSQILLKNNVVSAPVYDHETKKYTGFLDIRDLGIDLIFDFIWFLDSQT